MFPHTVTVYNQIDGTFYKKVVNNVFFHIDKIISNEGKGDKYTYANRVIFSNIALNDYLSKEDYKNEENKENYFTLKNNDIIVLSEFDDISDLSDIQKANVDYFLIRTISDNRYGDEELQNIEVTN